MKKLLAVLVIAGGCFSATPPGITGVPGKSESSDAKIHVFATAYHYAPDAQKEVDDVTLQISSENPDAKSFSASIAYEGTDGVIRSVTMPTAVRPATWPIAYSTVTLANFKRIVSASVQEMPPPTLFIF